MSNATVVEVAIDGCGPGPEHLIRGPFFTVQGNVMERKGVGEQGCERIMQEHMGTANLIEYIQKALVFFSLIGNY